MLRKVLKWLWFLSLRFKQWWIRDFPDKVSNTVTSPDVSVMKISQFSGKPFLFQNLNNICAGVCSFYQLLPQEANDGKQHSLV